MYTSCPHCHTSHKVNAEILSSAAGVVRCAVCEVNFDALPHLRDRPSGAKSNPKFNVDDGLFEHEQTEQRVQDDLFQARKELDVFSLEPEFLNKQLVQKAPRQWPWWLGSAALILALLAQYGFAYRADLLRDARTRPLMIAGCKILRCALAPIKSTADIVLISRDVRPHPSEAGALLIEATLTNRAQFTAAFPDLEIALADLNDQTIAVRRFAPNEYLGDTGIIDKGIEPLATALVSLEVEDPGKNAVAFRFEFR